MRVNNVNRPPIDPSHSARGGWRALGLRLVLALAVPLVPLPYLACSSSSTVHVSGVSLSASTLNLSVGGASATLTTTFSPANASNKALTWSTSDASVATVSDGRVAPVGPGSATITATSVDGGHTATCTVTVVQPVVSVSVDPSTLSLDAAGAPATLTATIRPANASNPAVTWSTSDAAVATVADGVVTPHDAGQATLTVTTADGARTATCVVTVRTRVSGLSISPTSLDLAAGVAAATLTPTILPANASDTTVLWSTSNAAVATVTGGVVIPVGAGSATITAATDDGGFTAACQVTVAAAPGPQLIALGTLPLATDCSGLTGNLENGNPESFFGGIGSGLAYAGDNTFLCIPDRGPNAAVYDASVDNTTAFISRFHTVKMSLQPNAGTGLPYVVTPTLVDTTLLSSPTALAYGQASTPALTDIRNLNATSGNYFYQGRSDGFGTGTSGALGDSRFDPEGIRVANDGQSLFISDEYGPYIHQFDRVTGVRLNSFTLPASFYVANKSAQGATEISGNTSGRVANKGMEGLAITPDGLTLVGFMQSPLIQDGGDGATVNRIVTIDIASGAVHQYAYDNNINGTAYNSSELCALNGHEFLVDERDGKGLGAGNKAVIKRLYKIDLANAAEVSGVSGEANLKPLAVGKTLFLDLVAALNGAGLSSSQIPAKIEGVAFGPDLVINGITKHTLWIANDNDFVPDEAGPSLFAVFAVSDADLGGSVLVPQEITPYAPTPVAITGLSLSASSLSLNAAGTVAYLTAVAAPVTASNKAVTWSSTNPAVASIAGGLVTPLAAGITTLTATSVDGAFTASCVVTVGPQVVPVGGVALSSATLNLVAGGSGATLTATVTPANASNVQVTWSSSNPAVASVTNGVVTPLAAGSASITATTADGGFTAHCTVSVAAATVPVTSVSLGQSTLALNVGGADVTLTATVAPANATNQALQWSTTDATVATVSGGVVHAVGEGSATLTVTTVDGGFTATCAVTVSAVQHAFLGFTASGAVYTKTGVAGAWAPADTTDTCAGTLALVVSNDGATFFGIANTPTNGIIYTKNGLGGAWSSAANSTGAPGTMKAACFDGTALYGFTSTGKYNTFAWPGGAWAGSNVGGTSGVALIGATFDGSTFTGIGATGLAWTNSKAGAAAGSAWTPASTNTVAATLVSVVTDGTTWFGISADGQIYQKSGLTGTWSNVSSATAGATLVAVVYK